ncbi:ABC transporter ATP-binding protein [Pseudovibrio exalbescens]|uniref:ABC transporter n=1 Tax=Pseudovibrio exalbescens TaxID=197461 RepID=A0A1U7JGM2_9HYPH|nr:ABC transporter ATP-binding protein [Pseudovibrio exalbescens]OKL43845.1 ABC transporter [Pseudovibrio exalbescens]
MTNILTVRDLHIQARHKHGTTEIVKGIDLDLKPGEVLGLVGESGAGKSTLGLAAMGYTRDGCRISSGSIRFRDQELVGASASTLRHLHGNSIAYVAQSAAASFNPSHRLIDQFTEAPLEHGVRSRKQAEADAIQLYREMQLPNPEEIGFRYPYQVSGGQLQRAMTAMAMSCKPDLIIFDEPTTALDVTTQIEVLAAIRKVVKEHNTAAIYITHDLAVVSQMADRIMVLRDGHMVETAPTEEMLANPKEDYTKSLWAVRTLHRETRPRPEKTPLLAIDKVTAHYGEFKALDSISFDILPQRTVAVVGESGSGKSTLAKVITGLLPHSPGGEIRWQGEALPPRLQDRDKTILRDVQMIYQMPDTALNPRHRVRDVVGRPLTFYLGLHGAEKEERLRSLMEQIELDPDIYLNRRITELSGGQKQRIGIARALAAEPRFIICDEVTSALDQLVAEGILKLLLKLQEKYGLTYMFITHDLATVEAIADDVVVMQHGKIVEQGTRDEVFSPPHPDYSARLLASVPEMDPHWLDRVLAEQKIDLLENN